MYLTLATEIAAELHKPFFILSYFMNLSQWNSSSLSF